MNPTLPGVTRPQVHSLGRSMMKDNRGSLVFALVFCWKIALFLLSAQPVPANDAFFYDGAVVNHLLHGGYYNPSVVLGFPISGGRVFSAYPPLYQLLLLGWMSVFGTSALSAMALQLCLIGLYMLVVLVILRRLGTPDWCVAVAGLFLFLLTFHDRPDTLAHVLGMLAVYALVRSRRFFADAEASAPSARWSWLMAGCVVLSLCTSLQIGATYGGWVLLGTAGACWLGKERLPAGPLCLMLLLPPALALLVKLAFPLAWAGFQENVRQTPFLAGLRLPYFLDVIKMVRTLPAVILVAVLLPAAWFKQRKDFDWAAGPRQELVLFTGMLAAVAVMLAALFALSSAILTTIVNYLQPVLVACYLTIHAELFPAPRWRKGQMALFMAAWLLGSVRSIGMSTWGLACAHDVGYFDAIHRVRQELQRQPAGAPVALSSAYLYEAAQHTNVRWLHPDWLVEAVRRDQLDADVDALTLRKPREMILTQFDFYRRWQRAFERVKDDPRVARIHIENTARTPAPDSIPSLQRVVQQISWAPVIVQLEWK